MQYVVVVTEINPASEPNGIGTSQKLFEQSFSTLDLKKFVVALNQAPRGRKPKTAK